MSFHTNVLSLIREILRHRLVRKTGLMVLLAFLIPFSIPLYLARIRFVRLTVPGRIGHLALDPDTHIKEQLLGQSKLQRSVIVSPRGTAANDCLLDYWRRYFGVVRFPIVATVVRYFERIPYVCCDMSRYTLALNETAPYIAVQREWGSRPPLLALNEKHEREGRAKLAQIGVPDGANIICFHCREGGYSATDEEVHSFRSCSIENYLPAVVSLVKRGYWCIRMGDPTMRRFQPIDGVVDYAHLDVRSDWMDVFLCASCKFFLGSSSGLVFVANVFGRPAAIANNAPLSSLLAFGQSDIAIPKLVWSEAEERYLTFSEIFRSDAANFRFTPLFKEHRLRVVENTAEDIEDLAMEMLARSESHAAYTVEDEQSQQRFRNLMRPGHYSFGGGTRVGRDFLSKYRHLLVDDSV